MTPDRNSLLARRLREDAAGKSLSGSEIAARAGIGQASVSRALRGQGSPSFAVLLGILGVLGRDLGWLHRQGVTPPPAKT